MRCVRRVQHSKGARASHGQSESLSECWRYNLIDNDSKFYKMIPMNKNFPNEPIMIKIYDFCSTFATIRTIRFVNVNFTI